MASGEVRPDETKIVERARNGDREAFAELVRNHQNEVFTLALRLVGDREQAADVSQEALVRAWRALPKFRGEARFSTWLHRIVVNTAWSHNRRRRRHRSDVLDPHHDAADESTVTPDRVMESAHARSDILRALDALSPGTRAVVVLKDVYDWSHSEIADHLGISVTAAKVRLHRGRKRLRDLLWSDWGGP